MERNKVLHFDDSCVERFETLYGEQIEYAAKLIADGVAINQSTRKLCRKFGSLLLTRSDNLGSFSGLVFAGFGEEEIYPRMREYVVDAILDNKVKYHFRREWSVDYLQRSHVVPFAQRDVVQTVLDGVSPSFARRFIEETVKMISGLPEAIINSIKELDEGQKTSYITSSAEAANMAFRGLLDQLNQHRQDKYSRPIAQSIGLMPMSELALVAELFVNLSQIQQKMSLDAETVGGPVDVAVISKGDGFVWIKRKHYFDKSINPLFIGRYYSDLELGRHARQQEGLGDDR